MIIQMINKYENLSQKTVLWTSNNYGSNLFQRILGHVWRTRAYARFQSRSAFQAHNSRPGFQSSPPPEGSQSGWSRSNHLIQLGLIIFSKAIFLPIYKLVNLFDNISTLSNLFSWVDKALNEVRGITPLHLRNKLSLCKCVSPLNLHLLSI